MPSVNASQLMNVNKIRQLTGSKHKHCRFLLKYSESTNICDMETLAGFLNATKKALASQCVGRLHVVLCNEACDLDSAVSAIVYGFLFHSLTKERSGSGMLVVPVLNIPAKDYQLRTEVTYWLNKHNITQEMLVFRDEVDLTRDGLELSLVDHNLLPTTDAHLDSAVVFVIDHHKLERSSGPEMIIEGVGSCCSLVTERILDTNSCILDNTIASLLHGTIILDTVNLSESAKRVTPKDLEMIQKLESLITPLPNRDTVFQELTTAKSDISGLNNEQLLRKDVKIVTGGGFTVAIASIPMMVEEYLGRDGVGKSLEEHGIARGYDIILLMGINIAGNTVERDMAVFSLNKTLEDKLVTELRGASEGVLQLISRDTHVKNCSSFTQGNIAASRKIVLPIVRQWLKTL